MEIEILKALNFNLGRPLSLHFLRRNSKAGDVSADHHNLAKFALEASFTEYTLSHEDPSRLAASSLLLALRVIDGKQNNNLSKSHWLELNRFFRKKGVQFLSATILTGICFWMTFIFHFQMHPASKEFGHRILRSIPVMM